LVAAKGEARGRAVCSVPSVADKIGKIQAKKSTKSDGVSIYYFLLTIDYFLPIFQPKAMVVENKNKKG
jgi:hypothetical protein